MITIDKSIKVKGTLSVDGVTVKEFITDINKEALSTTTEYIINGELYNQNRKQMRADEKAYTDAIISIEDEILAKIEEKAK